MKAMLKLYILSFVSITFISCAKMAEIPKSEVSVKVSSSFLQGKDKVETDYLLEEKDCRIHWSTIAEGKSETLKVHLLNRSACSFAFEGTQEFHEKVLSRVFKVYSAARVNVLSTGSLRSLQPNGSWSAIVGKQKNSSAKSPEQQFIDHVNQLQPHAPFRDMLKKYNLNIELDSVEKLKSSRDDASILWWLTK